MTAPRTGKADALSPAVVRVGLGLVVGALASVLGAFMLGEYEFTGVTPYGAGLLFGLVVAEVVVAVGGRRAPAVGVVSGLLVAGGLLWAAWISSGEGLEPLPAAVWPAMTIGAVAAALRAGRWRRPPPAARANDDAA